MKATTRQWLCSFLASAVLLVGAGVQTYMVHTRHLTRWDGGGFGMFSTIDDKFARFVRCYLITPQGEIPVRMPSHLDGYVRQLWVMPTHERAAHLARFLTQSIWVTPDFNTPPFATAPPAVDSIVTYRYKQSWEPKPLPEVRADIEAVRLEIWRYRFDTEDQRLTTDLILQTTTQAP